VDESAHISERDSLIGEWPQLRKIFVASRSFGKVVDDGVKLLRKEGEIIGNPYGRALSSDELRENVRNVDAALLGNDTCDANVLNSSSKLIVVSRHGIGVDSIDLKSATENGIVVANTPKVNTTAVVEHTMALMLAILRKIPGADLSLKSKNWEGLKFVGEELAGKKLGIIGLGAIGKHVAKRAKAFGVEILYTDEVRDTLLEEELGMLFVPLHDLLRVSDVISIHVPLTSDTRGLIGRSEILLMKKGVYIVNTARGGIVDADALAEGLRSGHIAGAAIDVFDTEPPDFTSPLFNAEGIVMTPHIGAYTIEAIRRMDRVAAENIVKAFHAEIPEYVVNKEVLSSQKLRLRASAPGTLGSTGTCEPWS
jgi:D-3-phosphoglycerate dehydrogenase